MLAKTKNSLTSSGLHGLYSLFTEGLVRMALGLCITVLIVRSYNPREFGLYIFYITFSTLALKLANLFIQNHLFKVFQSEEGPAYYVNCFWIGQILSFVLFLSAAFLMPSGIGGSETYAFYFAALPVLVSNQHVRTKWLLGQQQYRKVVTIRLGGTIVSFLFRFVVVLNQAPWHYLVLCIFLELTTHWALALICYRKFPNLLRLDKIDRAIVKTLAQKGVRFFFSASLLYVFFQFDTLWLRAVGTIKEVGIYSLSQKFLNIALFFIGLFPQWALPRLLASKNSMTFFRHSILGISVAGTLAAVIFVLLSPFILPLLLGPAYAPTIPLLQKLAVTIPGAGVLSYIIQKNELNSEFGRTLGVGCFLLLAKIVLNLVFYPQQGVAGVVLATLICIYSACLLSLVFYMGKTPDRPK